MNSIKSIKINYNDTKTELCKLGEKYGTDKSPYNKKPFIHGGEGHRHPYTCYYDTIFKNNKDRNIVFAEIGILRGDSIRMWREYFTKAKIFGFNNILNKDNTNVQNCSFDVIDVKYTNSITNVFHKHGKFDIIIDDASHKFNDQINIINVAHNYLNKNGILVIEDIFEDKNIFMKYNCEKYKDMSFFNEHQKREALNSSIENLYFLNIKNILHHYKSVEFISVRHNNNYTPGWNNNKLLVLKKN